MVVAEPTDLSVVRSHKGLARFRIRAKGIAAHSSKPYLGVNAILQMTKIIKAIEEQILPTYNHQGHPLVGSPTLNIGLISGGTQINFVPDQCTIELDRRTIPGEKPSDAILPFQRLIEQMANEDRQFEATIEAIILDNAMETEEHEEILFRLVTGPVKIFWDSQLSLVCLIVLMRANLPFVAFHRLYLAPAV